MNSNYLLRSPFTKFTVATFHTGRARWSPGSLWVNSKIGPVNQGKARSLS